MSFLTKPKRGFVLGKFMPPHAGHVYLCDFARAYADELTILVCSEPDDPIPGKLRLGWMLEMFPGARVIHCEEALPQEPADDPEHFWPIWKGVLQRYHPEPIDVVFSSEPYGQRLAAEAGARFVPVDEARTAFPISATAIRNDPYRNWRFLPGPVRLSAATQLAEQVNAAFDDDFIVGDNRIHLGCRIGIAVADSVAKSADSNDAASAVATEALFRQASAALLQARAREPGSTEVFQSALGGEHFLRMAGLETDLRDALVTNQIMGLSTLRYQDITPLNIVMKLVSCNGQPVAKLSDTPSKNMCDDEKYLAYLRQVFDIPQPG